MITSKIFMPEAWIQETNKSNEISLDGVFAVHDDCYLLSRFRTTSFPLRERLKSKSHAEKFQGPPWNIMDWPLEVQDWAG
jgi:hypothetical protein